MAINVEIEVGTSKALKSINDLEGAAADLKTKLGGTDIGTEEFERLAGTLKKVQGELDGLGASTQNINKAEASIKSLQGATELVAGSIATGVGALALFGANSEKLGEIEKKVQGSIAIALGVREAAEGALLLVEQKRFIQEKATQVATKAAIAVQAAYNAVLAANPIALVVIAVAGLIAGLIALKDKVQIVTDAFEFANKKFNQFIELIGLGLSAEEKAAEASKKLAEGKEKQFTRELELLKAKGASEEDIYKKSRQLAEAQLAQTKKGTDEYANALNALSVLDASYTKSQADEEKKRQDDANKAAAEKSKKRQEDAKKALDDAKKLNSDLLYQNSQFGKDEFEQRRADALKTFNERKAILDKAGKSTVEAEKAYQNQLTKIQEDADLQRADLQTQVNEASAVSQQQTYNLQLQQTTTFYDNLIAKANLANLDVTNLETAKNAKLEEIRVTEAERLAGIQKTIDDAVLTKDQAEIQAIQDKYAALILLAEQNGIDTVALKKKESDEITATETAQAEASKAIERQKQDDKIAAVNLGVDAVQGALGALFEDNKKVQIANTLIDAAQAAIGIFRSSTSLPEPFATINRIAQLGILAAATASSISKIKSVKPGSGGGGSPVPKGGSAPSVGGGGGGAGAGAPLGTFGAPATGFFTPGQTNTQGGNVTPIKTYVLAGDVTSAQAAEAKLNQRRQF
jgi:hypothetical protein